MKSLLNKADAVLPLHMRQWISGPDPKASQVSGTLPTGTTSSVVPTPTPSSLPPTSTTATSPSVTPNAGGSGSNTRPGVSMVVEKLVAVTSEEYERYDRKVKVGKHRWEAFMIEPIRVDFLRPKVHDDWKAYTHPEGIQYFQNTSWDIPVITDVYIYDTSLRERLEKYVQEILAYINLHSIKLPVNISLVLEFRLSGRCGYYFVNHDAQCLFWLDEFDAMVFLDLVYVKYTPSLIGQKMKSMYWRHNAYFPELLPIREENLQEMIDFFIHAIGDSLTSPTTTTPYSMETLDKMLAIVKDIKDSGLLGPGCAATLYRFLHLFYQEKFLNLHGEYNARLDVNQSIHPERQRTVLIKVISPLLLYGPDIHFRQLTEISVDFLVRDHRWTTLLQTLTDGWKGFTLYATVLLNANMAFLAIQSVDSSASHHRHSSMQRASYFSIMTSVGGILLGLLLVWQHQYRMHSVSFIADRSFSGVGLETLAILYSLPYSFLMWSFISFLLAFILMCLDKLDVTTIVMIVITGVILLLLLTWGVVLSLGDRPFIKAGLLRYFGKPDLIDAGVGRL